jgi:hypothetical protein
MDRRKRGAAPLTYSEILRVIGAYIDHAKLSDVRVLETDEGMILQGRQMQGEKTGQSETYQLTKEDIETLLDDAKAQRGQSMKRSE